MSTKVKNYKGELVPNLVTPYDMGWRQKRESNSGHGIFYGALTGLIVKLILMQRRCQVCIKYAQKYNLPLDSPDIPHHEGCLQNHSGTSKSMEALACV